MLLRSDGRALRSGLIAAIVVLTANIVTPSTRSYAAGTPTIAATKSVDKSQAQPGDTLTYTVKVQNTGSGDATGVSFTDSVDPNTSFVPGSTTASPVAVDDSYAATGNIPIAVPAASGLLANDFLGLNPAATVTASDTTSAQGGTVAVSSNGSFTYTPPGAFTGTDTFHYTLSNGPGSSSQATVTITVSNRILFVSSSGSGTTCRSATPCTLAQADSTAAVSGKDLIYVLSGTYSSAAISLTSNQSIVGQGVSFSQALTDVGIILAPNSQAPSFAASAAPALNNSATIITLGGSNLVEALVLNPSGGSAILGNNLTSSTVTVRSVTVTATSSANGVNLTGTDTGSTFAFSNIGVTAASGTAFNATGGGTITATQDNTTTINTLTTTTGTALKVQNTTIGASGLTFRSISSNGATNGIVLSSTGTTGGLTVTGDGASDPANTIRGNTTAKAGGGTITLGSGGTIQNTTGSGILLNNAAGVSLTSMNILNAGGATVNTGNNGITATTVNGLTLDNVKITGSTGNSGLRGTAVTNLSLQHVDIDGNGTAVGTETNDNWNVRLDDLAGNCGDATNGCRWSNSLFFNSRENIVGLKQGQSNGTVSLTMTITNSEFRDTTTFASPANDAFGLTANQSAVTNITATGSTFKNVEVTGFQYVGNDNSSGTINVRNSAFENTGTDINIAHAGGSPTLAETLNFDVSGNTERQTSGNPASTVAVNIFLGGLSKAGDVMLGTIKNNTIGNVNVSGSGSHVGDGIDINATGAGTITATVSGNTVHQIHQGDAFFAEANSGAAKINVSVHSNSFNVDQSGPALAGAQFVGGADPATDSSTLCLDMVSGANTFHGDTTYAGVEMDALGNSNGIKLVGYSGSQDDSTAITNFINAQNTSVTPTPIVVNANGAHITGTTTCGVTFPALPQPSVVGQSATMNHRATSDHSRPTGHVVIKRPASASGREGMHTLFAPAATPSTRHVQHRATPSRAGKHSLFVQAATPDVSVSIGTLPAGKSVTITFQVTISNSTTAASVSNQGTVSGTNFSTVQTNAAVTQIIIPTTTAVTSSKNPSLAGDSVTFTATVSATVGTSTPTGSVQFQDNGSDLGSPQTLNGSGVATLTTSALSGGQHTITTNYLGQGAFQPSSGTLSGGQTVNAPPAITSANNATFTVGTAGTFTVTATGFPTPTLSESGTLPGGVTFKDNGDGTATLSGTPVSGTGGTYSLTITAHNGIGSDATQTFTLTVDEAPAITSANHATFTVGTAGTFAVTTSGIPSPTLTETGTLPSGVSFIDNGNGTATLSGTPAARTGGIYTLTLRAHNGVGSDGTQSFTLTVNEGLAITSPDHTTFTVGQAGSFSVTTTGFPTPSLTESGNLPTGVTFKDNGDGTASLSGTPASGTAGTYSLTLTAHNGVGSDATQPFTLTVDQAPAITSADHTTFTVGTAGSFTITTTGFPAPTLGASGSLPTGVTFTDNGDGTATLAGTPAAGTGGTYSLTITAHNGVGSDASQAFTLTVNEGLAITSPDHTTFTVGSPGSFKVTSTGSPTPALSESGALPTGVTFTDNGDGTASLSGTPASGTAGTYSLTLTAHNGVGSDATQPFTLTVDQAPAITSADHTTFTVGTAGSFTITTTGFPAPTLGASGSLPTGVTFTDNGDGTATLAGTPAAGTGGTYSLTITAHNGVGSDASQAFTLTVNEGLAITSPDHTTFTVGTAGTFTVTTHGFPLPALSESGALPTGVSFKDNGDGTATLGGTPAGGMAGTYTLTLTAHNGVGADASQPFTLTINQAAAITSPDHVTFTAGSPGSFKVTSTGSPTPALSESGSLPTGVTFTDNKDGTATLGGTPAAGTGGTYVLTLTAHNGVGSDATQSFTLMVNEAAAITSANHVTFTVGSAGSFTVTTRGFPFPSLTETGALPSGVSFKDNGNGTATLAGTPAAGTAGSYSLTFTAHNGVGSDATQPFTLTVNQPTAITSANHVTFTVGSAGSFTVTASGSPTPTLAESGTLPSGVTFHDNGNGTATLGGTPAAGTGGTYALTITANNGVGSSATQPFTLTVNQAPAITSANTTSMQVGSPGSFTVTATGFPTPSLTESGSLPGGVTFHDNGNGTASLSGTPGTAGTYGLTLTAHNGVGSDATQSFTLVVTATTTVTLSSSANPSLLNGSVTFTATVGSAGGTPTGSVTFRDGSITLGVVPLDGTGRATLTTSALGPGSHTITATYGGGGPFMGSSGSLVQQVTYNICPIQLPFQGVTSGHIKIKLQLCDAARNNLSSPNITLTVTGVSPNPGVPAPGGTFSFIPLLGGPNGGYQYSVDTTRYPRGTYNLLFTVPGDPVTHQVQFTVT